MKGLFLICMLTLVSCMGGSGGSSGGSSVPIKVEESISDSTLIVFTQTSGVASSGFKWMDMFIARAYAATGNISCYTGQDVSFDMDLQIGASVESLQVDATCGSDIELKVRQSMLAALDGHILVREKSYNGTGVGYWLDFSTADGFQFDIPYTILEKNSWTRHSDQALISNAYFTNISNCYLDYTFNYQTGRVSNNVAVTTYPDRALVKNEATNTTHSIANPNAPSSSNTYEGCSTSAYIPAYVDFRFKDGKIEFDESGTKRFSINGCAKFDSNEDLIDYQENGTLAHANAQVVCPDADYSPTYERYCIDDNANGACD